MSISTPKHHGFTSSMAVCSDASALSIFQKPMVSTNKIKTTIVSVATNLPASVLPLRKEVMNDRKLVAWKSVRQERWEGELFVEGEIPKWLV